MSGSKLSLSKKLQKFARVKDKPKEKLVSVFTETVNLNETSEFQTASSFNRTAAAAGGRLKRKCKETTEEIGHNGFNGADSNSAESDAGRCECQVCCKDLSHMTVQGRQQHVNRCIDKTEDAEQQKKEEERLLESARNAVLNCPICGKQFKSNTARVGHLKKCSRENNVLTDRLLQLTKDQEKERTDQLAAGIIPQELRTRISKAAVVKKRKLKEPRNQYEEDVQVAMAISSSITGEQQVTGSMVTKSKVSAKRKGKQILEDVCLLTTLSDEERQKRMEEKINDILQMSINNSIECSTTLYESELKASHPSASLWDICSCSPESCPKEEFYVGALIPPVCMSSNLNPVSNLRRLSSIPGREKSFIETKQELIEKGLDTSANMSVDDIISVSTQTAVVLAELAADHTEDTEILNGSPTLHSTNDCNALEASGFCVDMMTLDESVQERMYTDTLADYRKLVNNRDYSDVVIVTSSGDTLYAHKLILLVRCPSMLQALQESTIQLDYPTVAVKSALKYLYTGEVNVAGSAQNELKKLAVQFELAPLISACDKLKLIDSKGREEVDGAIGDVNEQETTELNMKEIWGESDSEVDNDDVEDDIVMLSDNEIEDDDYRDIMATQRKSLKNLDKVSDTDKTEIELKENKGVESPTKVETARNITYANKTELELKENKGVKSPTKIRTTRNTKTKSVNNVDLSVETEKAKIHVKEDLPETADNDKSTDNDTDMPKHKRLRLSDELETDECNVKYEENESIVLSDSSDEDMSVSHKHVDNDCITTKTVDDAPNVELNDSYCANTSADLFASPSPTKIKPNNSDIRSKQPPPGKLDYLGSYNSPSNTVVAKTVENKVSVENLGDFDDFEHSELSRNEELSDIGGNISNRGQTDVDMIELDENSGDDVEITGDNFDEIICTPSPTFNRSKTNSMPRVESPELDVKSKYLGLESKRPARCDKYPGIGDDNMGDSNDDSDEVVLMQTEDEVDAEKSGDDNVSAGCKTERLSRCRESVSCEDHVDVEISENVDDIGETGRGENVDETSEPGRDEDVDDTGELGRVENVDETDEPGRESSELCVLTSEDQDQRSPTIPTIPSQSFHTYHADVWEDFDDCGMGYEPSFVSQDLPASRVPMTSPKPTCSKSEQDEVIDLSQNEEDKPTCGVQIEDELCQDFLQDGDDSFVFKIDETNDDANKQVCAKDTNVKAWNFKTPVVKRADNKKKIWMVPSPFTPMPKYTEMATPALKKEVHKFGVKPVGKKRMVKILEDIYQQTHQYETDSEVEEDVDEQSGDTEHTEHRSDSDSPGNMEDDLMSSQGDVLSHIDIEESCLEESCLHMSSSDSDTSASPQKNVDVTKKLMQYFKSHSELHLKVLTFEPIELDVLKKDVKEYGIKCSMDKLMAFLDEKCIAFTTKNTRKNRVQKKKGKKKTNSKSTKDT